METKRIGILGGGQLGRMLALASYPLGIEVKIVDDGQNPCAAQVSQVKQLSYRDFESIAEYFFDVDVVTYEFENIPQELLQKIAEKKRVFPPLPALQLSRHRGDEKKFVGALGVKTPKFLLVASFADLLTKISQLTFPLVVKTCSQGYDGKGQWRFKSKEELNAFDFSSVVGVSDLIAEEMIDFDYEVSCIGVRAVDGKTCFYPICENIHDGGILSVTRAPSQKVSDLISKKAIDATQHIMDANSYVGVIAVEYFVKGDELMFNEYAPRVHNSGHWTIEGAATSQFENHIRACLNLPLGSTEAKDFSLMLNLLGVIGEVNQILAYENAHYHWYGKKGLGNRRKVGHVTAIFKSVEDRERGLSDLQGYLV